MARDMLETEAPQTVDLAKIDTLHELLALAIGDFEKVLEDPRYVIEMDGWHLPKPDGKCAVCLGGSVLAKSLGQHPTNPLEYADIVSKFGRAIAWQMVALNALRSGRVTEAISYLGKWFPPAAYSIGVKWSYALQGSADHMTRAKARRLISKLRLMHSDLKEAGL